MTIDSKYINEYTKRANEIQNIIINAYLDYYRLFYLKPYLEKYKPVDLEDYTILAPARDLLNSIVRTFQEEFILIVCSLENDDVKGNSIKQLKAHLREYILNFDACSKSILKMPKADEKLRTARNQSIAHIDFNNSDDKISIDEVKNRLDKLKECFNSYLFGETVKYKIEDSLIDRIKIHSDVGVQHLLSGFVNAFCKQNYS